MKTSLSTMCPRLRVTTASVSISMISARVADACSTVAGRSTTTRLTYRSSLLLASYYYDTKQWQTCDDPCTYCTKTEYLGFQGQNECFKSCCDVDLDDVTDEDTKLSYRVSPSCHDWQHALVKTA